MAPIRNYSGWNQRAADSQEQNLNQDAMNCIGKLTSNIGKIISDIRNIQDPIHP